MSIFVWAILSVASGILGRLGGSEHGNRLFRTLGVPLCCCSMLAFYHWHWVIIVCFGTILGITTTYWKRKGEPVRWINWAFYGIMEGVALFPYIYFNPIFIKGYLIRIAVCAVLITLWDELVGNDVWEERGRYFIVAATMPLLFIGT